MIHGEEEGHRWYGEFDDEMEELRVPDRYPPPRTYTPVGDLPVGTHFRASRQFPTVEFIVIEQQQDHTTVRRTEGGDGTAMQINGAGMVWPLSDFAR